MKVTALAPWFGSNRLLGHEVGKLLKGCKWIGVPFAGGMAELVHLKCCTLVVNDLHRHIINLAWVAGDLVLGPKLWRRLRRRPFHPMELRLAQSFAQLESEPVPPDLDLAEFYFVSQWMGRSGKAGTENEFDGNLPIRWNANGGDSCVRYRSAAEGLKDWRKILARANFSTLDAFEFLEKCKDLDGNGIYCDAPWPDDGDEYRHRFDEACQRRLASELAAFAQARVVVRFGDHPLIRELYPADQWHWNLLEGRTQAREAKREVLLVRNGAKR